MEIKTVTRELFENHIEEFCQLYEICFNQKMSPEEVRWRYLKHPQKDIIACFALENNRIVANYALSPMEMNVDGEIIDAVLALNTMTHPDYWGKGLFVQLAKRAYEEAAQKGYKFVVCFPNHIANRICVSKLGWEDIYEIPTLELNLEIIKREDWKQTHYDIHRDDQFCLDYNYCLNKRKGKILVNKSAEYLRWRYASNPRNKYINFVITKGELVSSYIICKEYKDRLNIIDFYMSDVNEMKMLFSKAIDYGFMLKKRLITTWAKIGGKEHLYLEKLGFRNNSPITYLCVKKLCGLDIELSDYRKWIVSMGDDNVY